MSISRVTAGFALAATISTLAMLAMPAAAIADDPLTLDGAYIVDNANVLDPDAEGELQASLDTLYATNSVQLFVVYVDSFTGADDREDWANTTADLSQLGDSDLLLAIAVDDRLYQFSKTNDFPLTTDELSAVSDSYLVPQLRDDNWGGAATEFATGIEDTLDGTFVADPDADTDPDSGEELDEGYYDEEGEYYAPGFSDGGFGDDDFMSPGFGGMGEVMSGGSAFGGIFIIGLIAVIGGALFGAFRRAGRDTGRRRPAAFSGARTSTATAAAAAASAPAQPAAPAAPAGPSLAELEQRAGAILVGIDDAITSSEQELGFAVAQFGPAATSDFTAALAGARTKVAEAFALRQKLDDSVPDTDEERREWTTRIIALCEAADAELDAQSDAFEQLRELDSTAPAIITAVSATNTELGRGISEAASTIARLRSTYSPAAIATVADNPEQARNLVALSRTKIDAARAAIAAKTPGTAAIAVRDARASTDQARLLLDAVATHSAALSAASTRLAGVIDATTTDLDDVSAIAGTEHAALIATATAALATARADGARDPLGTVTRLENIAGKLSEALDGVREGKAQAERAAEVLTGAVANARSQVAAADDYVASRRGGVGTDARTRLAAAHEQLDLAMNVGPRDAVAALAAAEQASSLAEQSIQLAQDDVDGFTGAAAANGSVDGAAIVGGILAGLFLGGGNSRGGMFGGTGSRGGMFGSGFGSDGFDRHRSRDDDGFGFGGGGFHFGGGSNDSFGGGGGGFGGNDSSGGGGSDSGSGGGHGGDGGRF